MNDSDRSDATSRPLRIAVMVGSHGRGSNMQAIVDGCRSGEIPGEVAVVVGTRRAAPAIERAGMAGVPVEVVRSPHPGDEARYADSLLGIMTRYDVGLVCLAGFMRLLPSRFVAAYRWRIVNVHPALLPAFGGRGMYGERVHRAVLDSGADRSGCTVHFVDEEYDHGPCILQATVPVLADDTPDELARRVLAEEHRTYVKAVGLIAEGKVRVEAGRVLVSGPPRGRLREEEAECRSGLDRVCLPQLCCCSECMGKGT
ncbi:MAG: phosphoribosylglycinamide formyltransferase [Armatimonadetes bacterium]|nr:phosphoribosylglycinamide formyltransferase [Armatimonadota bacterium]